LRYGGLEFNTSYDLQTRIAKVQGQDVELKDANMILVDNVDSPNGPRVVETMTVDARALEPASPFHIQSVLKRSPKLVAYLRCDARLPDPGIQRVMDIVCGQVSGK
jgi:hypothetical protein